MRALAAAVAVVAALSAGCRKHKEVPPDRPYESGIPRKVATEELTKLLPTSDAIYCSDPNDNIKPSKITRWSVGDTTLEIAVDELVYRLVYAEMTNVRLEQKGKYFYAKVFTHDPKREHLHFRWPDKRAAEQAVELFGALRTQP